LIGLAVAPQFRGVDPDQAQAPPVTERDGVTVMDVFNLHVLVDAVGRAGRRGGDGPKREYQGEKDPATKKGAIASRPSGGLRIRHPA
jgi:hypothetical protein